MKSDIIFCNKCGKAYSRAIVQQHDGHPMYCAVTCCGYVIGEGVPI